jgi:TRAP-type mannitol/chloroaromatic compound transport system permease small subunit
VSDSFFPPPSDKPTKGGGGKNLVVSPYKIGIMKLLYYIDKLSGLLAVIGMPLAPILSVVVFYDVVARYFFNAPTFWAYEISWMLYSANFLLGLAYALREGAHVRVDVFLNMFRIRLKAIIEVFFLVTTLFVFCLTVVGYGIDFALESWKLREGSMLTMWAPPVYHMKTIIVIAFFVLGLQGIAEFVRKFRIIIEGCSK